MVRGLRWVRHRLANGLSSSTTKKQSDGGHIYKVKFGSDISAGLQGRLISLNITCPQEHSCLLLKLNGKFQCPENATRAPVTLPAGTSAPPNTTANPNDDGRKEKAVTSGGSSAGTVFGVVVALVIIVAIVIVIVVYVYVYRKRKRGESVWLADYISSRVGKSRSTEIPEEQRRNAPVEQAGGIYNYAFDNPQAAYIALQPAPYNRLVHNQQRPDQEGATNSTADDGPVYNVLQGPVAEKHITMTPESTRNEGPPPQDLKPEFRVLKWPETTDGITDSPLNGNANARASTGTANPSAPHAGHVALKERRKPPSPPSPPRKDDFQSRSC